MSRKAVNRLYENKAQLNSISMHLGESVGMLLNLSEHISIFFLKSNAIFIDIKIESPLYTWSIQQGTKQSHANYMNLIKQ